MQLSRFSLTDRSRTDPAASESCGEINDTGPGIDIRVNSYQEMGEVDVRRHPGTKEVAIGEQPGILGLNGAGFPHLIRESLQTPTGEGDSVSVST